MKLKKLALVSTAALAAFTFGAANAADFPLPIQPIAATHSSNFSAGEK
jgi:hypothetical protein